MCIRESHAGVPNLAVGIIDGTGIGVAILDRVHHELQTGDTVFIIEYPVAIVIPHGAAGSGEAYKPVAYHTLGLLRRPCDRICLLYTSFRLD